jgi:hypothetical protein
MFKHSKGKLETRGLYEDHKGDWFAMIQSDETAGNIFDAIQTTEIDNNGCELPRINKEVVRANARHLCACWNEHEGLKAKAALFDEMVKTLGDIARCPNVANCCADEANKLISKSKEL